jgi:hypothetical protein
MANINSVSCSYSGPTLTVSVMWDTAETGTLTIYNSSGTAVAGTVTGSGPGYANWQPSAGAMTPGQPYWAQVVVTQVPSLKIALLWNAPTNVVSSFDGRAVTLSWTAPSGLPTPGSYSVTISDGNEIQIVTTSTTKVAFTPSLSFTIGDVWTVSVMPTLAISTGPAVAGTVLSASVALASVACTALSTTTGQIALTPATTTYTSFVATLTQNGATVLSQTLAYATGTPMKLPVPAGTWPLSPAGGYMVFIQPVSGPATGPRGVGLPVVVTAPAIALAAVTGGASPTVAIDVVLPPGTPKPSGFTATVTTNSTTAGSGTFTGSAGVVTLKAALGINAYVLTVSAIAGPNSTGPTVQVTLLTAAATITAINNDAGMVGVTFTAAGPAQVDIAVGGVVVASGQTASSPLQLPAPAAAVPFTVSVRGAGPHLLGPPAGPVQMICQAPTAQGVAYDIAGVATLSWAAPTAAAAPSAFTIETYDGGKYLASGTVTGGGTTSGPVPTSGLVIGGALTALVRGTGTDATTGATLSGPRSMRVPVLINAPGSVQPFYDGATARISWTPPAGAQVDGYLVTLTDSSQGGVATLPRRVAGTSLSVAYGTKNTSVVTVAVQATGGDALGQAATAPLFTPALFPSTNTANAAYVAPSASLNFGKQPLAIYLPAILATPGGTLPTNTSFTLATTATSPWTYLLTVNQSDAVWTFDASAIRAALLADITDFMTKMSAQGLTAQGDLLLRQVFARVLPMTFVETMFYAYNFNAADGGAGQGQGLVDLTPGMALRVEVESYESLPPPPNPPAGNAGMVGNAVFDYDIGSYRSASTWRQGFDAFLSRLVGHGVVFPGPSGGVTSPLQTGAGGSPDFYYPNFLQPYYRLIYPPTYMSSVDVPVSQNLRSNVTLIAAATRADLDTATKVLRTPAGNFQPVNAVYFRGRTLISPRIHVLLNGSDITVPLGTSVANLLARFAALAAAGGRSAQVSVHRGLDGVAIQGWPATLSVPVRLDWTGGATWGDGTTWLDLPLLHGDRVNIDLG